MINCAQYLRLSPIDHQVIKLAEDALLQLVPGDGSVLPHQERRSKPSTRNGNEFARKDPLHIIPGRLARPFLPL